MMDDNENKRVTFREESESSMEGKKSTFSKSSSYSQISMAHIGRPIAQVSRIPDPVSNQIFLRNIFPKILYILLGNGFFITGIKYAVIWIILLHLIFKCLTFKFECFPWHFIWWWVNIFDNTGWRGSCSQDPVWGQGSSRHPKVRGFLYFLLEKNLIQNRQLPTLNTNLSSENYWVYWHVTSQNVFITGFSEAMLLETCIRNYLEMNVND